METNCWRVRADDFFFVFPPSIISILLSEEIERERERETGAHTWRTLVKRPRLSVLCSTSASGVLERTSILVFGFFGIIILFIIINKAFRKKNKKYFKWMFHSHVS